MGMDTEEMYRRGVADAAQGEPHPFYYQHYYQYRRGYDRARRSSGMAGGLYRFNPQSRIWLIVAVLVVLLGVGTFVFLRTRARPAATTATQPSQSALASAIPPTRTPIFPTPTSKPTDTPAVLRVGGKAQVINTEGSVLRGRKQPTLKAAATAAFKEDEQVTILEGPVDADGFTWWKLQGKSGTGWSAQQSKDGMTWLMPIDDQ